MRTLIDSGTLVGVFEHLTDAARRTLVKAQGEAHRLHDGSIDPEHLLLGLLREDGGITARKEGWRIDDDGAFCPRHTDIWEIRET